jgi:anaerobic ribonucleoside-triphosphate reductase activating protein
MAATLSTTRIQDRTAALGPGSRAVVWFHGCALNCPGCIAKEMNDSIAFTVWTPDRLAEWALCRPDIEGLTLSGGDPFDQNMDALWAFVEAVKTQSDLTLVCYTGRTLAQLRATPAGSSQDRVLGAIDILIDGPYVESLNDGSLWRGSSNQQVHFLSDRYVDWRKEVDLAKSRELEVRMKADGSFDLTGIPPAGFLDSLTMRLKERGLELTR